MRVSPGVIAVFILCLLAVGLYIFLGRAQISKQIAVVRDESAAIERELESIRVMERQIPVLMQQLPVWRDQVELYSSAIPSRIDDQRFFGALADQLERQDVDLLGIEVFKAGPWLGKLGETQIEELEAQGIDAAVAQQVNVAFYSASLIGTYPSILSAFENLKQSRRLYSIDQVTSPAILGGGTISQSADPEITPVQLTGRIYYGVPEDYVTVEKLVEVFGRIMILPKARSVQQMIRGRGQELLGGAEAEQPAPGEKPEQNDEPATAPEDEDLEADQDAEQNDAVLDASTASTTAPAAIQRVAWRQRPTEVSSS